MKTKLELAHEYVVKTIGLSGYNQEHMCRAIEIGWDYADAMYEQQEQREIEEKKKSDESHKRFMSALKDAVDQLKNKEGK